MAQGSVTISRTAADATVAARLRRAMRGLRSPWVMLETVLVVSSVAVGALWLEIPDQTTAQITLSFVIAIGGCAVFLLAQSYIFILVRRRGEQRAKLWKGALLLAGLGVVYTAVTTFFDVGEMRDVTRAAWWSLKPGVNTRVSADSLMLLQGALWSVLRYLVLTALLPFAMEGVASAIRGRWIRRAGWLLLEPLYWSVVMGCAILATGVTEIALQFRPHAPMVVEILLTVGKTVAIVGVDLWALCYALSLTATFLRDAQLVMPGAPAGRPSSGRRRRQ